MRVLKELTIALFAITAGLTLSGIAANLYRLFVPGGPRHALLYCAVMVFAGPSMLFEHATRAYRRRDCSRLGYALAVMLTGYWCFALGLGVLSIGLSL